MKKKVIGGLLIATTLGMTTLAVAQSDGEMHGGKNGLANIGADIGLDNPGEVVSDWKADNSILGAMIGTVNGRYAGTGERSVQSREAVNGANAKARDRAEDKLGY